MLQNKTQVSPVNFRLYFKVIIRQNAHCVRHQTEPAFSVLKHIFHSQDVFFRNLLFTSGFFKLSAGHGF